MNHRTWMVLAVPTLLVGCGESNRARRGDQPATTSAVQFLAPASGDSVTVPFVVQLGVNGVEVVPATGLREEGKGHHHLIIDGDVPSDTVALGAAPLVIHLGAGVSEYMVESLAPGPHRIIAVFAYGDHVPMLSARQDTINVIVR